jgi:hypothetical protein
MGKVITHIGFSDESHWNEGQFRRLELVTLSIKNLNEITQEIHDRLDKFNVKELKWKKVRDKKCNVYQKNYVSLL